ncbi:hypothetical protein ACH5RR_036494 [Cinchona calisaya]|uniref:Uncharacterized protein n=1 Tax=Cinchona calisaya TaxID=153742 RepID=A0ABD2Y8A6_9GENT
MVAVGMLAMKRDMYGGLGGGGWGLDVCCFGQNFEPEVVIHMTNRVSAQKFLTNRTLKSAWPVAALPAALLFRHLSAFVDAVENSMKIVREDWTEGAELLSYREGKIRRAVGGGGVSTK